MRKSRAGFTLIELLVVIGIMTLLATSTLLMLNPARQFAQTRNAQRWTHINSLVRVIQEHRVDHSGLWSCAAGALPESATLMTSSGGYDICGCIIPDYASQLTVDPSSDSAHFTNCSDYNTGYTINQEIDGRIKLSAPGAELGVIIGITQ